jgi:hypothetical protein
MNWYKKTWIEDEAKDRIGNLGMEIVQHETVEGYDLIVTKGPQYFSDIDPEPFMYQIGIQKEEYDFTNREEQFEKKPMGQMPNVTNLLTILTTKINEWLGLYKRLYIGSMNESRNPKYARILTGLGYNVQSAPTRMGVTVSYIE